MKGNTLGEFIDDLLTMGGPEKEFVFRGKKYFLETVWHPDIELLEMFCDEYTDDTDTINSWYGNSFEECVRQFEVAAIFDGMTIYQAEQEIEVIFG